MNTYCSGLVPMFEVGPASTVGHVPVEHGIVTHEYPVGHGGAGFSPAFEAAAAGELWPESPTTPVTTTAQPMSTPSAAFLNAHLFGPSRVAPVMLSLRLSA